MVLNLKDGILELDRPAVMAILNVTPDSFYAESRSDSVADALRKVEGFLNDGAKFIDIGAYSSRPGAADISIDEELARLLPIISAVSANFPEAIVSVDTFRAKVAEEAVQAGAHLVNDISAGKLDDEMFPTVARLGVPYIMMHMQGTPQNMQQQAHYEDVTADVMAYFDDRITLLESMGINNIIVDPGFGFAKTIAHNYELLQKLEKFHRFNRPILVGFSRKSMVTKVLGNRAAEALNGTSVLNTAALLKGASILRVHDVREAVECIKLIEQLKHPQAHFTSGM